MDRKDKYDIFGWYLCGRCKTPIEYLVKEGKQSAIPCPDCGYHHAERPYTKLPAQIRIDLSIY